MMWDGDTAHIVVPYIVAFLLSALLIVSLRRRPNAPPSARPFPTIPLREYLPSTGLLYALYTSPKHFATSLTNLAQCYNTNFSFTLLHKRVFVVVDAADIHEILKTSDRALVERPSSQRHSFSFLSRSNLFIANPHVRHTQLRRSLKRYLPVVRREEIEHHVTAGLCERLGRAARDGGIIDVSHVLGVCTFQLLAREGFGVCLSDTQCADFQRLIDAFVGQLRIEGLLHPFRQLLDNRIFRSRAQLSAAKAQLDDKIMHLLSPRLASEAALDDLLDFSMDESHGDVDEMVGHVLTFFIAGSHTASLTLSWALYELAVNPSVFPPSATPDDLTDELVDAVWNETLRLHPPNGLITRQVGDHGMQLTASQLYIPPHATVYLCPCALHRAYDHWGEDADQFRPSRWMEQSVPEDAFLPFGAGPRACPGVQLAEIEGIVILKALLQRFVFRLAVPKERVKSCTELFEVAKCSTDPKNGGVFDVGVPMFVKKRQAKVTANTEGGMKNTDD